jgi:hypothetical protein
MLHRLPALSVVVLAAGAAGAPAAERPAGLRYVKAKAYYVLPETHNNQSGYFSLCEGLDGSIYIGTAKYGENAYLVEFDPRTGKQRVVIDTHALCGLNATGYAAQAKIHTRNFVGPSGRIYVGSKQGYRKKGDTSAYPGGYVMVYDPRVGRAESLGMPMRGQGVIDVAADEARGLLYVVTCEQQHWMLGDVRGGKYRELGPLLTPYAMTLIDAGGRAFALTRDFQLACYDPATKKVQVRPIEVDGRRFVRANDAAIPTWVLAPDRRRAYLILMNDPTLIEIDLQGTGTVRATKRGKMVEGKHPDSRCALDVGPDGRVYAVVRVDNETGYGKGYLHKLARFDPAAGAIEELGALVVENPDYFDFDRKGPDGKRRPWTHGFHRLPDGSLTPMYAHMAMMAADDGTIYVTIIYPFTLLRVEQCRRPPRPPSPASMRIDQALATCDRVERQMPQITKAAEVVAERHLAGGLIGFPFPSQSLAAELYGRSGGIVHIGFDRPFRKDRTDAEKARDVGVVGYDGPPAASGLAALKKLRGRRCYLIGVGPAASNGLRRHAALCDAWIDTGGGEGEAAANAIGGWVLVAEVVSALTRRGRMPTMWKSYAYDDGRAWGERYFRKKQFHDDCRIGPIAAGQLGRRFLRQIRCALRRLRRTEAANLRKAGRLIAAEMAAGRRTIVAWQGHMPMGYVGKGRDAPWAKAAELHPFIPAQVKRFGRSTPDGALVLSLGYHGLDPAALAIWRQKKQRVIHLAGEHPDPAWRPGAGLALHVDLGFAFGDACVSIDGYPIRILAPSGILQKVAYDAIDAEVRSAAIGPQDGPRAK